MADYSWIDPLFKSARGAFGLDPEAQAKGALIQREGDFYDARTADTKAHTAQVIPATVAELTARAGMHGASAKKTEAETAGIGLKNKGAQMLSDFLADDRNYVTTQDGRRVPDTNKLQAAYAAASLSAGDKAIQHLPHFMGGLNLQGNALSPAANLAAGGANAAAGAGMVKPIDLPPDHTLITKDAVTGAPVISRPVPNVPMRNNVGSIAPGDLRTAETGTAEMPAGSSLSALMSGVGTPAVGSSPALGPVEPISNIDATFQAPTNKTQLQLGAAKNTSNEAIASGRNQTTLTKADKDNAARAEVARLRGASAEEVARIRSGAKPGVAGQPPAIDLVRRSNLEKEAVKAVVEGFSAGDSVNPEHASILASAAIASFPNDPPRIAVQKFMQQERIKPGSQVFGSTEFLVDGNPYDFNALRARLFGQGGQPQAAGAASTAAAAPTGASVVPRSTVNAFMPPAMRDPSAAPVIIPPTRQAPPAAVGAGAGQAPQPASQPAAQQPATPARPALSDILTDMKGKGVMRRDAKPGFNLGGVDFVHGESADPANFKHGEVRLATPNPHSPPVPMYYNADTGKFQSEEPAPQSNESNYPDRVVQNGYMGNNQEYPVNIVYAFGEASRGINLPWNIDVIKDITPDFNPDIFKKLKGKDKQDYLNTFYNKALVKIRESYLGDPRIDQWSKGLDEIAMPKHALRLADLLGMNRAAFGIEPKGPAENLPAGVGMMTWMAPYGRIQAQAEKNLPRFFQAVREGRFDPKTMTVNNNAAYGSSTKNPFVMGQTEASLDGTPKYTPSPHEMAAMERKSSDLPTNESLADAIAERTGPTRLQRAKDNASRGVDNAKRGIVNLGEMAKGAAENAKEGAKVVGSTISSGAKTIGSGILSEVGSNVEKAKIGASVASSLADKLSAKAAGTDIGSRVAGTAALMSHFFKNSAENGIDSVTGGFFRKKPKGQQEDGGKKKAEEEDQKKKK